MLAIDTCVEGLETLTDVEKRAFFINLYNCLTFH